MILPIVLFHTFGNFTKLNFMLWRILLLRIFLMLLILSVSLSLSLSLFVSLPELSVLWQLFFNSLWFYVDLKLHKILRLFILTWTFVLYDNAHPMNLKVLTWKQLRISARTLQCNTTYYHVWNYQDRILAGKNQWADCWLLITEQTIR